MVGAVATLLLVSLVGAYASHCFFDKIPRQPNLDEHQLEGVWREARFYYGPRYGSSRPSYTNFAYVINAKAGGIYVKAVSKSDKGCRVSYEGLRQRVSNAAYTYTRGGTGLPGPIEFRGIILETDYRNYFLQLVCLDQDRDANCDNAELTAWYRSDAARNKAIQKVEHLLYSGRLQGCLEGRLHRYYEDPQPKPGCTDYDGACPFDQIPRQPHLDEHQMSGVWLEARFYYGPRYGGSSPSYNNFAYVIDARADGIYVKAVSKSDGECKVSYEGLRKRVGNAAYTYTRGGTGLSGSIEFRGIILETDYHNYFLQLVCLDQDRDTSCANAELTAWYRSHADRRMAIQKVEHLLTSGRLQDCLVGRLHRFFDDPQPKPGCAADYPRPGYGHGYPHPAGYDPYAYGHPPYNHYGYYDKELTKLMIEAEKAETQKLMVEKEVEELKKEKLQLEVDYLKKGYYWHG